MLGPTASGKTSIACALAAALNGEIISADSRQVYKHLTIGTGKDLHEYVVNGKAIRHHLIDVVEPDQQFYLHSFIEETKKAFDEIHLKNKLPIICGGTGLYLDSFRKDFSFTQIKENQTLRDELKNHTREQLVAILDQYPSAQTSHVDRHSIKRLIRGIEVARHLSGSSHTAIRENIYRPYYIGIDLPIEKRKEKITSRLIRRLEEGLIAEVENLLKMSITHERLQQLGLEYKFVSLFIQNKISRQELFEQLQTAIFQFSKRQMTWFRKMEKEGVRIHWLSPEEPLPTEEIKKLLRLT